MFAKQTIVSASLVALLGGSATAIAEPDPEEPASGEVQPPGEVPPEPEPPPPPPKRHGYFAIGAGFSSVESFIATATIAQDNLFGTGKGLALSARISKLRQLFAVRYIDPSVLGSDYGFAIDLVHDERVLPGFARKSSGGALTLSKELAPHLRAFGTYKLEQVEATEPLFAARTTAPMPGPLTLSSLRGGLEYNTLDDPFMPMRGTRVGGSIEIADRRLGSDASLVRTEAWASTHAPIGPLTLHLGGRVSTVSGEVPRTERLFLDVREIRGFDPAEIGPLDGWGMAAGGTMKISGRAELEAPLSRKLGISAVGFLDAGGVFDRGLGTTGMSCGVGLVWRSPIGPLRFDWAWRRDGGGPVFGFGFGF